MNKASQTITFGNISDKMYSSTLFPLNASASSSLPVSFKVESGQATLTGNSLSLNGMGMVTIKAAQEGNKNYESALEVTQSFCVLPAKPVITSSGITLSSSSTSGNQWYLNGLMIVGATAADIGATSCC